MDRGEEVLVCGPTRRTATVPVLAAEPMPDQPQEHVEHAAPVRLIVMADRSKTFLVPGTTASPGGLLPRLATSTLNRQVSGTPGSGAAEEAGRLVVGGVVSVA